jgi:hypothetical protein
MLNDCLYRKHYFSSLIKDVTKNCKNVEYTFWD